MEPKPGGGLKRLFTNRAQSFGLVLAIGFPLLVSLNALITVLFAVGKYFIVLYIA